MASGVVIQRQIAAQDSAGVLLGLAVGYGYLLKAKSTSKAGSAKPKAAKEAVQRAKLTQKENTSTDAAQSPIRLLSAHSGFSVIRATPLGHDSSALTGRQSAATEQKS